MPQTIRTGLSAILDSPVDASEIAVAERLKADVIATLDHRHFSVVRSRHSPAFKLLPDASD